MRIVFSIILALTLTSCAKQTVSFQNPNVGKTTETNIVVEKEFDKAWSSLVENLAKSFFVINNIEKESGIINVSFSTGSTGKYIDCGYAMVDIDGQKNRVNLSESTSYASTFQQGIYTFIGRTDRKVALEGRINIFVKEKDKKSSIVTANSKYIVSVNIVRYNNANLSYATENSSINFNTNSPGSLGEITCRETGKLEEEVLNLATKSTS